MADRKVVGVDESNDDDQQIHVMYTDDDKVFSFAKSIKNVTNENDRFAKSIDDIRQLDGLNPAMKSKMTRRINKYLRGDGAESKSKTREEITGYGVFETVHPLYNLDYLAKLYEVNPTHYAAVNAKVSNVISLGYHWEETQDTQDKIAQLVNEGDEEKLDRARRKLTRIRSGLDEWLESLNEEDNFIEILEKVYADRETMGQGYLEVGRNRNGTIGYVGHIPAHTIRARRRRDGFVQIVGNKVTYFRNFGTDTPDPIGNDTNPNELIVFKKYSARSTYYGVPDIVSAINAIAGAEFASKFNLDYFEHKAVPRYMIVVKGAKLSQASERKLVEFFQTNLKGEHHRSVYIPLPKMPNGETPEIEILPIEAKIQDASFIKYHEWNRGEILMAHRVPPSKIGLAGDKSIAAAREADKMFKEQVTRPTQGNIEKKLQRLVREKTNVYDLRLNELTLTDEETRAKIHEKYLRWQVETPNEVREDLGMKGIEGGDEVIDTFGKKTAEGAEQRSQARQGRRREQRQGDGPNNSGDATRQPDGAGERDRG